MPYSKIDFINDFQSILEYKSIDTTLFEGCFEYLAQPIFEGTHQQGTWYDGFLLHEIQRRKSKQIKLVGKMWVALNNKQWLEACEITLTDQTIVKQGIMIKIKMYDSQIEKSLDDIWD